MLSVESIGLDWVNFGNEELLVEFDAVKVVVRPAARTCHGLDSSSCKVPLEPILVRTSVPYTEQAL